MAANRMLRWMILPVFASSLLLGCGKESTPTVSLPKPSVETYHPQANSSNAFDDYALAAAKAEETGGRYLDRVSFYPDQKKAAGQAISAAVQQVLQASSKPCDFRFTPRQQGEKLAYHRGWRLIGRVLEWRVEDAVQAEDFDGAVKAAVDASKFGFDLTGGDAIDADLGLTIVDNARRAILPALDRMTPGQLLALSEGMAKALARRANPETTIANEDKNIQLGITFIHDRYKAGEIANLQDMYGSNVKDAVDYLRNLRQEGAQEEEKYFVSFAEDAEQRTLFFKQMANLSAKEREGKTWKEHDVQPYWRFGRHLFGTLEPFLNHNDATLARTRLLIATAKLRAGAASGSAPDLSHLESGLASDPYSGKEFVMHRDDTDFLLYSVGPNLKDDGGETDATFSKPDLLLEVPL